MVPLKAEYYKALAHYHAAKSINIDLNPSRLGSELNDGSQNNSFIFDDNSLDGDVNPIVMKRAHLKESISSHEEAQRQQRMCRELKVRSNVIFIHKTFDSNSNFLIYDTE